MSSLAALPAPAETSVSIITNAKVGLPPLFSSPPSAIAGTGDTGLAPASNGVEHSSTLVAAWSGR